MEEEDKCEISKINMNFEKRKDISAKDKLEFQRDKEREPTLGAYISTSEAEKKEDGF